MAPFQSCFFVGLIAAVGSEAFAPVAAPRKLITQIKNLPQLCQRRSERSENENFFIPERLLRPLETLGYNLKAVFGEIAYAAGTKEYESLQIGNVIYSVSVDKILHVRHLSVTFCFSGPFHDYRALSRPFRTQLCHGCGLRCCLGLSDGSRERTFGGSGPCG